jgi:hypothetical protein
MQEWGREGFDAKLGASWRTFATQAADWIAIERGRGPDAISTVYAEMLGGKINPAVGHILSP